MIYPNSPENIYGVFMTKVRPLERFPLVRTNSIDEAEVAISRSLANVTLLKVTDRDRFQLHMNGVKIGSTSLIFNRYETDTYMKAGLPGDSVLFLIGGKAPITIHLDKGS